MTLVERRSLFTVLGSVMRKKALAVTEAITSGLEPYEDRVLTLTLDNGREFTAHEKISEALGANVYFAHPYASWERGTNENTNGLLRQYFPKGMKLTGVSKEEVQSAADRLNNRPRKKLGFRTPHEVFFEVTERTAVALGA